MKKVELLSILDSLVDKDLSNYYYSLTINYINIVMGFNYRKFDISGIKSILNSYSDFDTYNLTITNSGRFNKERYSGYYYDVNLVFHSDGIVFSFLSPYLSNRELVVSDIDNLFKIYDYHKLYSASLYGVINNLDF